MTAMNETTRRAPLTALTALPALTVLTVLTALVIACGSADAGADVDDDVDVSTSDLGGAHCGFVASTEVSWGISYYRVTCKCGWVGTVDWCSTSAPGVPSPATTCMQGLDSRCERLLEKGPTDGLCTWMERWGDGSSPWTATRPKHCICKPRYASSDGLTLDLGTCEPTSTTPDAGEDEYECRRRLEEDCASRWPTW
jgi:hypothetical protein